MKSFKFSLFFVALVAMNSFAQTDILNTDFQLGMPVNYSIVDNDGLTPDLQVAEFTSAWIIVADPDNTLDSVAASTSFFSPVGTANRWLITPPLALGAFGNFISWEAKSQDASYPDDYLVMVSTTDDQLASFTDTIGSISEEYFEWTSRTVDLSAKGYDNQTIYVAFVNVTEDGFKLYIDDIHAWKEDPVGIEEINNSIELVVYPNPTTDKITVKSNEPIQRIELISSNGQKLIETSGNELNLNGLVEGAYFVKVYSNNTMITRKLIKN